MASSPFEVDHKMQYKDMEINTSWTDLGLSVDEYCVIQLVTLANSMMNTVTISQSSGTWKAYSDSKTNFRVFYIHI